MNLCILGRQSDISIAELEAVFGSDSIQLLMPQAVLCSAENIDIDRLGGTQKVAKLLFEIPSSNWKDVRGAVLSHIKPEDIFNTNIDHKFSLGISVYGINSTTRDITGLGLEIKKAFKKQNPNQKTRVVPNKEPHLSTAQVNHNKLSSKDTGAELLLIGVGSKTYVGLTTGVQDINAYAERDQARPVRDARVGMLPPKLAQIILNLSTRQFLPSKSNYVLDPFCGTGVLLQEALLTGWSALGSDISPRMQRASMENLLWLKSKHTELGEINIEVGDATTTQWAVPFFSVATEMYLGEPQTTQPSPEQVKKLMQENEELTVKLLTNLASQVQAGTQLCIAMPAWRTHQGFEYVDMVDHLKKIGYTQSSFKHIGVPELIYARPDQITGRRLLVLTKN